MSNLSNETRIIIERNDPFTEKWVPLWGLSYNSKEHAENVARALSEADDYFEFRAATWMRTDP